MKETTFGLGILLLSKNPKERQTTLLIIACDLVFPKKVGFCMTLSFHGSINLENTLKLTDVTTHSFMW